MFHMKSSLIKSKKTYGPVFVLFVSIRIISIIRPPATLCIAFRAGILVYSFVNNPKHQRSYGLVLGKSEGWTIRPRTRPGLVMG
jgi:hypothetical protein